MTQQIVKSEQDTQRLIFVIGCPGAGKGTLCSKLAEQYGWTHFSVGHELRRYVRHHGQPDGLVAQCVRSGQLLPEEVLVEVIGLCLQQSGKTNGCPVVLDGLPRHASQIACIHDKIGIPDRVICFECPEEIARDRVLTRNDASRVDNDEIFGRRYAQFCSDNPAVVTHYEAEGKLVRVNTHQHEDHSFLDLVSKLSDLLSNFKTGSHEDA